MRVNDRWEIDAKIEFTKTLTVTVGELGGVPWVIGKATITPATLKQQQFNATFRGRGFGKHIYELNWEMVAKPSK